MSDMRDTWSWRTRWVMRRNALIGSARFQQWAARVPLFRSVARRKASAQFDLIAGFVYTQILTAFVEFDLLDFLRHQPRLTDDVTGVTGLSFEAADRLLHAAAALDIAAMTQPGLWTLGEAGAALSANPGAIAMIRHHRLLYSDLADPAALFRADRADATALSRFWTYTGPDAGRDVQDYSTLMAATQPMVAREIVPRYDFARHRRMLDIGGGSGRFAQAVAAAHPALDITLFDLPAVLESARAGLANDPVAARIMLHPGSFRSDSIPHGHDLVTLVRILHDHDDGVVQDLLRSIHAALPANGTLLIAEPLADSRGARRMGNAYFGVYLWAMRSGRPRSFSTYRSYLTEAGFRAVRRVATDLPIIASIIVATK